LYNPLIGGTLFPPLAHSGVDQPNRDVQSSRIDCELISQQDVQIGVATVREVDPSELVAMLKSNGQTLEEGADFDEDHGSEHFTDLHLAVSIGTLATSLPGSIIPLYTAAIAKEQTSNSNSVPAERVNLTHRPTPPTPLAVHQ
jgi:hypothetical protein